MWRKCEDKDGRFNARQGDAYVRDMTLAFEVNNIAKKMPINTVRTYLELMIERAVSSSKLAGPYLHQGYVRWRYPSLILCSDTEVEEIQFGVPCSSQE